MTCGRSGTIDSDIDQTVVEIILTDFVFRTELRNELDQQSQGRSKEVTHGGLLEERLQLLAHRLSIGTIIAAELLLDGSLQVLHKVLWQSRSELRKVVPNDVGVMLENGILEMYQTTFQQMFVT